MGDSWTEISAAWKGNTSFVGQNSEGVTVYMDSPNGKPVVGPMQLLLMGLAGCAGMDVVSILQKKRVKLTDFKVTVRAKRAETYPMVWLEIQITYFLWGKNVNPKDVERAIQLSEEKYCSVGIMLAKTAKITSKYLINNPAES